MWTVFSIWNFKTLENERGFLYSFEKRMEVSPLVLSDPGQQIVIDFPHQKIRHISILQDKNALQNMWKTFCIFRFGTLKHWKYMEISPSFSRDKSGSLRFISTPLSIFCGFQLPKKELEKFPFSKKKKAFSLSTCWKTIFPISSVKTLLKKKNGDFSILLQKEWRFLHSFRKRMEKSPFFSQKNGEISILFFRPHSAMLFWIFTTKKKNGEISILKKKYAFSPWKTCWKTHIFSNFDRQNASQKKRMEISPFFWEKNGDFSILLRKEWRNLHSFFRPHSAMLFWIFTTKKREWRNLHSPKQKGVFTFNMLKSIFCSISSDKTFFTKKMEISPFLFTDPMQQITSKISEKSPFSENWMSFTL